jgi:hypothetical protein
MRCPYCRELMLAEACNSGVDQAPCLGVLVAKERDEALTALDCANRDPYDQYERATKYIGKVLDVMHDKFPSQDLEMLLHLADQELDSLYLGEPPNEEAGELEWRKRADAICRMPAQDLLNGHVVPYQTSEYST